MIERKLKKRKLREEPAIVIAAFGTTSKGKWIYDLFKEQLEQELSGFRLLWAYTSEIIREKTGLPGILQALSVLEQEGFRKAVVQPLHIVPGTEYQILSELCRNFPGIRVVLGETLLHRWQFVEKVLEAVSKDFINENDGINLLVTYGTPLTFDPVTSLYLGLERLLYDRYKNVYLCSIEGLPDSKGVFNRIKAYKANMSGQTCCVRLIPLMFVPGKHVEDDLMGQEDSFSCVLKKMGFKVELLTQVNNGVVYPKGLGCYREVREQIIENIKRSLELMRFY